MLTTVSARSRDDFPVSDRVLDEAIAWQVLLDSGDASDEHHADLIRWLEADGDHARAWRQLGLLDHGLHDLPRDAAAPLRDTLMTPRRRRTRKAAAGLLSLALLIAVAAGGLDRHQPLTGLLADHRTGTGEQRTVVLPDGTVVVLNTRSAIDLAFDADRRAIVLRQGEIHVRSAPASAAEPRPLMVLTPQGSLRALGTRFIVRHEAERTTLTVTESAVMARPAACDPAPAQACPAERRVSAGHGVWLHVDAVGEPTPVRPDADAWIDGMLVVENTALGEVVAELARHRAAPLTIAADAAELRVTGTVPLADTERALTALTHALPVRLVKRGGVWLHVERER